MRHVSLAVKKYQERAAFYAREARSWMEVNAMMAHYFQRESALDYEIARNLMGVKNDA